MASEQELMDLLKGKGLKTITQELEKVNTQLEKTSYVAKQAFDFGASKEVLQKYSDIMGKDIDRALNKLYGKTKELTTLEEKRHAIATALTKAIDKGTNSEQKRLHAISQQLDKHIEIDKLLQKGQKTGVFNAIQAGGSAGVPGMRGVMGAIQKGGGILDMLGGASKMMPTIAKLAGGGAAGGIAAGAAMGLPLAGIAYGASRMKSGYNTYRDMIPNVVGGMGQFGQAGMSQMDLYGSNQGYSAVERAGMLRQLASAGLQGEGAREAGVRGSQTLGQAERLSRTYGLDVGQMIGMSGQASQMSGGGANIEQMMAEAVASGVNRARISGFMEKSLRLGEQVYATSGKKDAVQDQNKLLAEMIAGASDKEFASRYGAEAVGRVGERIRSVGMGGGDLATQGYMYRAFNADSGGKMDRYEFMKRAQEGGSGRNVKAMLNQSQEFGGERGTQMAFTQMFGLNFKQTEVLQGMKSMPKEAIEQKMKSFKNENFLEKSPEGRYLDTIAKNTNVQAQMGKDLLPLAQEMLDIQRHIDTLIAPMANAIGWVAEALGGESKEDRERKQAMSSPDLGVQLDYAARTSGSAWGGTQKADSYRKIKDDKAKIGVSDLTNFGQSGIYSKLKYQEDKFFGGESDERRERRGIGARQAEGVLKELQEKKIFMTKTPAAQMSGDDKAVVKKLDELIITFKEKLDQNNKIDQRRAEEELTKEKGRANVAQAIHGLLPVNVLMR